MDLRAVIFMPALVGSVVFGFVFVLFASHYYLTVLESTGAGAKDVTWGGDSILDNYWKLWYMLWLFGLWFGPAYFLGRAVSPGSDSAWLKLAIPIAVVWLCYPVSQLSSLSATTIWLPLVPDVFGRLAQKPGVTLGFFLLSIPVLALFAVAFKWSFLTESKWELLFVGAPLMVLTGLLYARLIGRLAFALRFTKSIFREPKKKKREKSFAEATTRDKDAPEPTIRQASDLPPLMTNEGELSGYDIQTEDEPRPRKRIAAEAIEVVDENVEPESRPKPPPLPAPTRETESPPPVFLNDEDDDTAAYGVHAAEAVTKESTPKELIEPKAEEMRLLSRDGAPKKPKRVWGPDLFAFLAQPGTLSAILIASGLCFVTGVMVRTARDFYPVD